jgi:Putative sensor
VIPVARLRLVFGAAPWRAAAYLLSSIVVSTVLFVVVVTSVLLAGSLALIGVGIPLLIVAAAVVRAATHVERQRAALAPGVQVVEPLVDANGAATDSADVDPRGTDHEPPGLLAAVRRGWADPAMGPSLGYLVGLFVPLLVLDVVAASIWLSFLGGVTAPLWYWAVPQTFDGVTHHGLFLGWFPHGPGGPDAFGLAVDDLPTALAVAGVSALLFAIVACPVVVAAARFHARIADGLLGPPADPLAGARAVLRSPGPLALDPPQAAAPRTGHGPSGRARGIRSPVARPTHLAVAPPPS